MSSSVDVTPMGEEKSLEELQRELEMLKNMKILPPPDEVSLAVDDPRFKKKQAEKLRMQEEIKQLERSMIVVPEEPTRARSWIMDSNGSLLDFNLTHLRMDLIFRLKNDCLFSFEECRHMVKEILFVQQKQAKIDFKNLMFLSSFRNDQCFPQPVRSDYLGKNGIDGFQDTPEVQHLLSDTIPSLDEDLLRSDFQKMSLASTIPILKPKAKLHQLLAHVNRSLVKLIDNGLRQRKERLLLQATILSELEQSNSLVTYLRYEGFPKKKQASK